MADQRLPLIRLVVGLGNPGSAYARTRHNFGFLVLDELAARHNLSWRERGDASIAELAIGEKQIILMKPETFMNSSGRALVPYFKKGITAENILVVHDELELPFGKFSQRQGGSARGHNGLKSIITVAGDQFYRLRCGIGRPEDKTLVPDYVLSSFGLPWNEVQVSISVAVDMLESIIF